MIELPYSLVIEATEEPDYFGFYSLDLEGFTGVGHSIEDCLYKAEQEMKEHVELLKEQGLPVPPENPDPTVIVQNKESRETIAQEGNSYLYHYTTADAFISIVKDQQIWASNIFYLNDSVECHWAARLARELLGALAKNEKDAEKRRAFEVARGCLEEIGPETIFEPVFAWCLSRVEDDLNQWRGYCPDGGIAIGFRRKELDDLVGKQGLGFAPTWRPCIYERHKQARVIRSCVDEAIKAAPHGRIGASMDPEQVNQYKAVFLREMLAKTPIKHASFRHEHEWRLVISPGPHVEADPKTEPRLGFRSRNGLIIPFWRIALAPNGDKRIWRNARIVVGPSPHQQELKDSVVSLLKHYCIGPVDALCGTVEASTVPYRYW